MNLEEMLDALFENRWPEDVNPYQLNQALGLKPWTNPAIHLWECHLRNEPSPYPAAGDADGLKMLQELHDEYQREKTK